MLPDSIHITTAAAPCVTLAEFAAHARLDLIPDAEQQLINAYITAAEQAISRELKRPLGLCVAEFGYQAEAWQNLQIAFTPLASIESVTVNGQPVDYTLSEGGAFPTIKLAQAPPAGSGIIVSAQVGWADVPQPLRVAVMMLAAGLFEHRMNDSEIALHNNRAFDRLLAAYRQEFVY